MENCPRASCQKTFQPIIYSGAEATYHWALELATTGGDYDGIIQPVFNSLPTWAIEAGAKCALFGYWTERRSTPGGVKLDDYQKSPTAR